MNMRERGFEVRRATRASKAAVLVLLLAAVFVASLPYWAGRDTLRDFTQIAAYLVFAMMWNLLAGYGGMVSIGQQAYFGIGGYAMLMLANYGGISPFVAVPIGAVIAAVIAVPVSLVAFRLEGGYFAIGTWVIAEVLRLSVANVAWLGGGSGTSLTAFQGVPRALRESLTLWTALAIVAAAIGLLYVFLRSRRGLALTAMRDNAIAANSQGVDVRRARLVVYLVSAAGTALAGGLYFVGNLRISPDAAFSVNWTAFAIFIVMIGGLGTLEGPIIGALIFFLLNKFLSDFGTWYLIGLGALAIVVTMFFPQGIWGYASRRFGWQLFPVARHVVFLDDAPSSSRVQVPDPVHATRTASSAPHP
ncbi:amino acid/amide ABC transporter membrane protein 2, HAAT family [Caballeronia arationis]|jgi:branched-chain amino acid transport system permease protein|uniref:Amino acid/amide ABC transporter membrane protein 2, HAAT family n=1 Tax=Caballeronia arationis TaxID=1777142 RepID=A0A7Z7IEP3_9BURK|nr:branched-chain amino acid ABC transporter permease [Caballeronia arationis]SOE88552.1 amino acid/amide ABC transporter membrane protein 2, HAAT family [Caballeronia arationis]